MVLIKGSIGFLVMISKPEYSDCSTAAIMALIRIRDDPVRDKAISSISNALKLGKHPLKE